MVNGERPRVVPVVEAVAEGIREAIFGGEFVAGEALTEASLSGRFDVPRPTVRSAVQLLMQDGLMRRQPNRSVYVPVLSSEDVTDLFDVRHLIETFATDRIVSRNKRPQRAFRAQRMLESLDDVDEWSEVVQYDFALHLALVDEAESPRMSKIYASTAAEMRLALVQLRPLYSSPREIAGEHRLLLDAISSGDRDRALAATCEHLATSKKLILEQLSVHQEAANQTQASAMSRVE